MSVGSVGGLGMRLVLKYKHEHVSSCIAEIYFRIHYNNYYACFAVLHLGHLVFAQTTSHLLLQFGSIRYECLCNIT